MNEKLNNALTNLQNETNYKKLKELDKQITDLKMQEAQNLNNLLQKKILAILDNAINETEQEIQQIYTQVAESGDFTYNRIGKV